MSTSLRSVPQSSSTMSPMDLDGFEDTRLRTFAYYLQEWIKHRERRDVEETKKIYMWLIENKGILTVELVKESEEKRQEIIAILEKYTVIDPLDYTGLALLDDLRLSLSVKKTKVSTD